MIKSLTIENIFIYILGSVLVTLLAYLVGKRKADHELKKMEAETVIANQRNVIDWINFYKNLSEDLRKELHLAYEMTATLKAQVQELNDKYNKMEERYNRLLQKIQENEKN